MPKGRKRLQKGSRSLRAIDSIDSNADASIARGISMTTRGIIGTAMSKRDAVRFNLSVSATRAMSRPRSLSLSFFLASSALSRYSLVVAIAPQRPRRWKKAGKGVSLSFSFLLLA